MRVFLFILLVILTASAPAQTVVRKSVTLIQLKGGLWLIKLDRSLILGDTLYSFIFRNDRYRDLIDVKSMSMSKTKLIEFKKGLETVLTVNPGDDVMFDNYSLTKLKSSFGNTLYQVFFESAMCHFNQKEVGKLIDAIAKE